MFKKLILSLPFVKAAILGAAQNETNYKNALLIANNEAARWSALCKTIDDKYLLALSDLEAKHIQIHKLTTTLDNIVDYFVPVKEQPSPLEYTDIPKLIISKCSQKTKSKKPKSKAKKAK